AYLAERGACDQAAGLNGYLEILKIKKKLSSFTYLSNLCIVEEAKNRFFYALFKNIISFGVYLESYEGLLWCFGFNIKKSCISNKMNTTNNKQFFAKISNGALSIFVVGINFGDRRLDPIT
ncbi:hypothetical protein BpHYR1_054508, partial [Brachionus plicatilis]